MDTTRWIWRFLLFTPIKTTLIEYTYGRYLISVALLLCSKYSLASSLPPNFNFKTLCFDAQSSAPLTTWSTLMKKHGHFKIGLLAFASSIAFNSQAAVIINEVDYDQAGTDTAEFIELFNTGGATVSLNDYSIDLVNGRGSSVYRSIDLSGFDIGASSYFVVCGDASLVANCDYSFTITSGWVQNGAPDAVALYEASNLLDSLSYEGELLPFTEGSVLAISDNNTDIASISRIANGFDSNNNALDFQLGCITPGSANIAGIGDCSVSSVSAVPLPAAVWLFGSGVIGMVGFARRK